MVVLGIMIGMGVVAKQGLTQIPLSSLVIYQKLFDDALYSGTSKYRTHWDCSVLYSEDVSSTVVV